MPRPSVFAHTAAQLPAEDTPDEDARPYRPYELGHTAKQTLALDLIDQDLHTDTLYYPYMLRVRYTPPRLLSLVCFDCVFTITGYRLDELRRLIRDHLVSEIRVFNARYHDAPPPHTPLIEKITIESRRTHEQHSMH
jgi:hypothetical protein